MIDYQHLKPGLYVQTTYTDEHGDPRIAIKGPEVASKPGARTNSHAEGPNLFCVVRGVGVRRARTPQTAPLRNPVRLAGDRGDVARMPFSFATRDLVPCIDESLQLYKVAYP